MIIIFSVLLHFQCSLITPYGIPAPVRSLSWAYKHVSRIQSENDFQKDRNQEMRRHCFIFLFFTRFCCSVCSCFILCSFWVLFSFPPLWPMWQNMATATPAFGVECLVPAPSKILGEGQVLNEVKLRCSPSRLWGWRDILPGCRYIIQELCCSLGNKGTYPKAAPLRWLYPPA